MRLIRRSDSPRPVVYLRLLSNAGRYPRFHLATRTSDFLATPTLAWAAVVGQRISPGESEISWLRPEEIRLLSAIYLSEAQPGVNGRLIMAPRDAFEVIPFDRRLFGTPAGNRILARNARRIAKDALRLQLGAPEWPREFTLAEVGRLDAALELLERIDLRDSLLIRGLGRLIAANDHVRAFGHLEDGAIAALIALEAILEIYRREISRLRHASASYEDVFMQLSETYSEDGEALIGYLRELYEARIRFLHPGNRIAREWVPDFQVDDCFSSIDMAVHLYRDYLLGTAA